jgi:hypothetical protein
MRDDRHRAGADTAGDDPGWRAAVGLANKGLLMPWTAPSRGRSWGSGDGLVMVRVLYLTFVEAVLMIGVVVIILDRYGRVPDQGEPLPVAGLVVAGGVLVQLVGAVVEKPLDASDPGALAASYRKRFFLRLAFAQAAALLGFGGFILTGAPVVFFLGLGVTLVGFARAAPTRAQLAADEYRLAPAGDTIGIGAALSGRKGPPSAPGTRPA